MAAAPSMLLVVVVVLSASPRPTSSEQDPAQRRLPHLTGCVSANMETFRCGWDVGSSHNLSEPARLRLFYINKKPAPASPSEWSECPDYGADRVCFFNENHTFIWTYYSVQLRSADRSVLYDENLFLVQDIVRPDPPEDVAWKLLNVSPTGLHYDVMLSWRPPRSADVEMGWMTLQYEVQYRHVTSDLWTALEQGRSTHRSLFSFQTNVDHEVRVRCKMLGGKDFGEFSSSVFVHIPSKESRFPLLGLLIFGALCLVAILMSVLISKQEKSMFALLPPVPTPKIRGINPELLKNGKLRELASILGGSPDLRPELCKDDPWVEFMELDLEEQSEPLTELHAAFLLGPSPPSEPSPLSLNSGNDGDSGRASCCCCDPEQEAEPDAASPTPPPLGREALYTQVSEVRASGKVLLSPEERTGEEPPAGPEQEVNMDGEKQTVKEKEKQFHLVLAPDPEPVGYTDTSPRWSAEDTTLNPSAWPYDQSDAAAKRDPPPSAPVYTVVEGVDGLNSLLLTPSSTPMPQLVIPKAVPTPDGYLTPDLLGSVTP